MSWKLHEMDSVIKKSHIFLILASFNGPLLNPELHLKPFSSESAEWSSCLKDLMISYYYTRALLSQTVGLLEVFRVSKSRMGDTVVSYQASLLWNSSQFGSRRQAHLISYILFQLWSHNCDANVLVYTHPIVVIH